MFVVISSGLHGLLWIPSAWCSAPALPPVAFQTPDYVEFGLTDGAPGSEGAQGAQGHAPLVEEAPSQPPAADEKPNAAPESQGLAVTPAATSAHASAARRDKPKRPPATPQIDAGTATLSEGESGSPYGQGVGLGFGVGGFGDAQGGPPGAVLGLHLDMDRIRNSPLVLEIDALLHILPEWPKLLAGSGLNPLADFSRLFVAAPNLKRSHVVMSARARRGSAAMRQAAQRLGAAQHTSVRFVPQNTLSVAPWPNRGPTKRMLALLPQGQFVIARPPDVDRVMAVAAAIAKRHARQPGMERLPGPASLLAMYKDEAAALSLEGTHHFVRDRVPWLSPALRISLTPIDEFYVGLRAIGYYDRAARAAAALRQLRQLREGLVDHPRIRYLGLRSAVAEADLNATGDTIDVRLRLTLHQTRYLIAYLRDTLAQSRRP